MVFNYFSFPTEAEGYKVITKTPGPLTLLIESKVHALASGVAAAADVSILVETKDGHTCLYLTRLSPLVVGARAGARYTHVVVMDADESVNSDDATRLFEAVYGKDLPEAIDSILAETIELNPVDVETSVLSRFVVAESRLREHNVGLEANPKKPLPLESVSSATAVCRTENGSDVRLEGSDRVNSETSRMFSRRTNGDKIYLDLPLGFKLALLVPMYGCFLFLGIIACELIEQKKAMSVIGVPPRTSEPNSGDSLVGNYMDGGACGLERSAPMSMDASVYFRIMGKEPPQSLKTEPAGKMGGVIALTPSNEQEKKAERKSSLQDAQKKKGVVEKGVVESAQKLKHGAVQKRDAAGITPSSENNEKEEGKTPSRGAKSDTVFDKEKGSTPAPGDIIKDGGM